MRTCSSSARAPRSGSRSGQHRRPGPGRQIRPGGQKVVVKAWTGPERTGEQVDVVLTEFIDPDGIDVYFKVPDLEDTRPIRIMDDELLSEPRKSANGEITFAWYGPKGGQSWKEMLSVDGELVADMAADYHNPQGKLDVPAEFPDTSRSGSWSFFNCRNDGLLSTAKASDKRQLNSTFKVHGCPVGYAYGLQGTPSASSPATRLLRIWRRSGFVTSRTCLTGLFRSGATSTCSPTR